MEEYVILKAPSILRGGAAAGRPNPVVTESIESIHSLVRVRVGGRVRVAGAGGLDGLHFVVVVLRGLGRRGRETLR